MLEINGLTKQFGGVTAVHELNLEITRGEMVGLIGPNGAGKTTAFNLITGFIQPTKGTVIFNGTNVTSRKPHTIAKAGMVRTFQDTNIFPDFTVLQNVIAAYSLKSSIGFWESVLHTPGCRKKEEKNLVKAIELLEVLKLDTVKYQPAERLSHGYKRMLGIAIAMAADPGMLLLDEPLSGMNATEVNDAVRLIRRIWERGTTIFLIEHNMRAAMNLCQKIIVLEMGRKIAEGTPGEIRTNERVIQAYLGKGKDVA